MKYHKSFFVLFLAIVPWAYLAQAQPADSTFPKPFTQKVEGWVVEFGIELKEQTNAQAFNQSVKALANHLQRITYLMPKSKLEELQKLPIRVDLDHELDSMQYHGGSEWLGEYGFDPSLQKRVHIPRVQLLFDRRMWLKQPYAILHELAHAYHDQVLGFENEAIIEAFNRVERKRLYHKVLDFEGRKTNHYALSNPMEFFAEMTEAYVGMNDFYPFVRAELKTYDPQTFSLMKKIWGDFEFSYP
jgi:hypothetical protein